MNPVTNRDKFYADELVRWYESQRHHGPKYLADTLAIYKENAQHGRAWRAYREAIRRINDTTGNAA